MGARDKAIEASRAKREAKEAKEGKGKRIEAGGSSKKRAPGAGKPMELPHSKGPSSSKSSGKRSAEAASSPPPNKKLSTSEKGKASVIEKGPREGPEAVRVHPLPIPLTPMSDAEATEHIWKLPSHGEFERYPGVPNDTSLLENLANPAAWEAFRSTIFLSDLQRAERWKIGHVLRLYAHLTMAANNLVYQLADRAHEHQIATRTLRRENAELKEASSAEQVEDLKSQMEKMKLVHERELKGRDEALAEAEKQILELVAEKASLEELRDKLRRESLEAFRRGEEKGFLACSERKDAEFRDAVPKIRLQAAEDFVRGPVFVRSTLLIGENDVDSGWNKALGQLRALGLQFDEAKLDKSLDKNLRPYPESTDAEDEEAFPDVEGHEFEAILDIVEEIAEKAREKQEAADSLRASAIEPSPSLDLDQPAPVVVENVEKTGVEEPREGEASIPDAAEIES